MPYTILVLVPRLEQIDASLEEAAYDLGASRLRTFRSITLPLILPAVVSALLIAFTTSFDEYAVASFVIGTRVTFPIYLYSALRFPTQLPQVIAVAVVVLLVSLAVVVVAEIGRRVAERRVGTLDQPGVEHRRLLGLPGESDSRARLELRQRLISEAVADDPTRRGVDVELGVHAEVDELDDRSLQTRPSFRHRPGRRPDLHLLGPHCDTNGLACAMP